MVVELSSSLALDKQLASGDNAYSSYLSSDILILYLIPPGRLILLHMFRPRRQHGPDDYIITLIIMYSPRPVHITILH